MQLSGAEVFIVVACILLSIGVCLFPWKRQAGEGARSDASQERHPEIAKGLPDDVRGQLAVVVIAPRDLASIDDQCPICLTDYQLNDVQHRLPCRHHFHKPCIDAWLTAHTTCPVCRVHLAPQPDGSPKDQQSASSGQV
ncbi:hypothetical protein CLOP_g7503 [Closterium sp. NIES-67]|nr:hypothetical protein CLOP_g7503 [Closterium sp. NIES-67]